MTINATYIATVLNSMIRMTSPILLAALTAAICNKVKVFNIGMEGTMMAGAFFSIVANYYTHSIFLAVLAGAASGLVISAINAICIIRFKASATVVGMAMNTLMTGATTYLLYVIFGVRGVFTDSSLLPLPRINLPIIKDIPFIGKVLANLTPIDYFAILLAVGMHIFLYKTVMGYRLRAIGINQKAARSLGTKVERDQFLTVALSGILCAFYPKYYSRPRIYGYGSLQYGRSKSVRSSFCQLFLWGMSGNWKCNAEYILKNTGNSFHPLCCYHCCIDGILCFPKKRSTASERIERLRRVVYEVES